MPKVMQIRDVPDDVHGALAEAAQAQGVSLTRYVLIELEHLARRSQNVRHNATVVRAAQAEVQGTVARETILAELDEGRAE